MPHQPTSPIDYTTIHLIKPATTQRLALTGYLLLLPTIICALLALTTTTWRLPLATISLICLILTITLPLTAAHLLRRNNHRRRSILQQWAATQGHNLTAAQARELIIGQVSNQIYGSTLTKNADPTSSITLLHLDNTWQLVPTTQVRDILITTANPANPTQTGS